MTATAEKIEPRVIWSPNPGGQAQFLSCPFREVLLEGPRGRGATDALLMDFAQFVGRGWGAAWRGILFRREYKHLDDIVTKSKRWFYQAFPGARFLASKDTYKWVWPTGEELLFRGAKEPDDYWDFHGHEYPWVGFDELTNWPNLDLYEQLQSVNRSGVAGMPRRYRSTANPWGAGHAAVKSYFIDPAVGGTPIRNAEGEIRMRIHGERGENKHLLAADPNYEARLNSIKNPDLRRAWADGDWDVNPGGFLVGVWDSKRHVVDPFDIPKDWTRWRAMDWGFARPFSVGWYAQDPDGVIYRYRELYGYGGRPDVGTRWSAKKVARKVLAMEAAEKAQGITFRRNPADTNLWTQTGVQARGRDVTPALDMSDAGVKWQPASKGPGSRVASAQVLITRLETNQFFVFSNCRHWLRTVPNLQYDPDNWEDIDSSQEDHAYDETRYSLMSRQPKAKVTNLREPEPDPQTFEGVTTPEPKKISRYRRR